ncbi:uncharacterized protein LOC133333819 [Musca vetustissima]|uniref:uncharacterized protein LOC133333819 n=1 Tax=Musca vetustissima TaxID=27455 RepID=UPI002AB7CF45|nr:uncharacterized protein LOC133333819 [Musca vetustissima]
MDNRILTYEELSTLLAQIEGCLNSRPLCPISTDPADCEALTPSHFLVGEPILSVPDENLLDHNVDRLSRWKVVQLLSQQFWNRWKTEYINRLQSRPKWLKPQKNVEVGDLVIIFDERVPPGQWPLARITEVHPGTDGKVRVVSLKSNGKIYKRPVSKVALLPQQEDFNSAKDPDKSCCEPRHSVLSAFSVLLIGTTLIHGKALPDPKPPLLGQPQKQPQPQQLQPQPSKNVAFDQQTSESQISQVAQQRIDLDEEYHHHHHEHHHDPGYWKKKVTWKEGWKKIWKPAKKQIWIPQWKQIWKPVWVPVKVPAWKEVKVPAWKQIWKPVWKEIQVPAWKEIQVPDWKKIWKPVWVPTKVPAWKDIQVPAWKQIWVPVWKEIQVPAWKEIQVPEWKQYWTPEWIKVGIPGEKYLGKDHEGWEYTSHDLWKKKLIWKSHWKKIWKPAKKQIWVPSKKLEWKEEWKQIWKPAKKQIWVDDKKLEWKEAWKQIWKPAKKLIWVPDKKLEWKEAWQQIWKTEKKETWVEDKKLEWKEAWKQIWVPGWKEVWVPDWKKIWKPVIISEWFPSPDHHDHHHHEVEHGWDRKDNNKGDKVVWKRDDNAAGSVQKSTQLQPVQTTNFQNKPLATAQKETSKAFKFPGA